MLNSPRLAREAVAMTLLGVISDTHDNIDSALLIARIFREKGVSIVVHLGDIVAPFTLKAFLEELKGIRFVAVYGNNCGEKLGLKRVAERYGGEIHDQPYVVEYSGYRILLLHGSGPRELTDRIARSLAKSGDYDLVLYGHTHNYLLEHVGTTLLLNPGEACGCLTGERTAAMVNLEERVAEKITV